MLGKYFIAAGLILGLFALWVGVQHLARVFAFKHPEYGPAKEEGGGCGLFCGCKNQDSCPRKLEQEKRKRP